MKALGPNDVKPEPRKAKRGKSEIVKVGNITVKIYRRNKTHKIKDEHDPAKVIRKDIYRVWEVEDYTTGRRLLHSFSHHDKAIAKAKTIANRLSSGDVTAAAMRNGQAASYGRAVELLKPTGAALELAACTYAKCFEILRGDYHIEAANFYARYRPDQLTHKTVAEVVAELIGL
jgi:hypothetical protein